MEIDLEVLREQKRKNFRERLWFIEYWVNYIKEHSDKEWSEQQRILIDSQLSNGRKGI